MNEPSVKLAQKLASDFKPRPRLPIKVTTNGVALIQDQVSQLKQSPAKSSAQNVLVWQSRLASNGVARWQFELGLRYYNGDGIETNRLLGSIWIGKAVAQQYSPAIEFVSSNFPSRK